MSVDIVALDPGTTTGIAILDGREYRSLEVVPTNYPHPHETLFDVLGELQPKVLVYEGFQFRQNQTGVVFTGIEYIGVARLYAQLKCIEEVMITPSTGKAFWSDAKLRALDVYKRGKPHANDAMRHLLKYRMQTDKIFMDEALATFKERL